MKQTSLSLTKLLLLSFLLFWGPLILFAVIANEVTEHTPLLGDVAILDYIHRHFSDRLSSFFLFFTDLGSTVGMIGLMLAVLAYGWYRKQRTASTIIFATVAGAAIANIIIKLIYQRQRPSLWRTFVNEQGFSFPSGHAMASSALAFSLIYVTWNTRWRWLAAALAVPFMLLVALSRLYFGVHYPSDIAGGWLASLLWAAIVIAVSRQSTRTSVRNQFSRLRSKIS